MKTNALWQLPVPSVGIEKFYFCYPGSDITIAFEYSDNQRLFYGLLTLRDVVAFKHSSEKFMTLISGSYDTLVEVQDSAWIGQIKEMDQCWFDYWKPKHFALFIKDYGLYEIAASDYEASEIIEGEMNPNYLWTVMNS